MSDVVIYQGHITLDGKYQPTGYTVVIDGVEHEPERSLANAKACAGCLGANGHWMQAAATWGRAGRIVNCWLGTKAPPVRGWEVGDNCNRDGCDGVLEWDIDGDCSCHTSPPCRWCEERRVFCPECEWRGEE